MDVRPIDANALAVKLMQLPGGYAESYAGRAMLAYLNDAPTLDYAPVVHGEFEFKEFEYIPGLCVAPIHCKTCGTTYFTINKDGKRIVCCPYCGAKMDGVRNE